VKGLRSGKVAWLAVLIAGGAGCAQASQPEESRASAAQKDSTEIPGPVLDQDGVHDRGDNGGLHYYELYFKLTPGDSACTHFGGPDGTQFMGSTPRCEFLEVSQANCNNDRICESWAGVPGSGDDSMYQLNIYGPTGAGSHRVLLTYWGDWHITVPPPAYDESGQPAIPLTLDF
jgi:hypothetical protein